jgi:hypothetical protein
VEVVPREKKIITVDNKIQNPEKSIQDYLNQQVDFSTISHSAGPEDLTPERESATARSPLQTHAEFKLIPEMYLIPGNTAAEDKAFWVFFTTSFPLQYNLDEKLYKGMIGFILLENSEDPGSSESIDPVLLEVNSDEIGMITPRRIEIDHLNIPSSEITLAQRSLSDSARLRIITASNLEGYETYIHVESPLSINCEKKSLQGYGIQKAPITVTLSGPQSSDSVDIRFRVNRGSVDPATLRLTTNQSETVYLRSEGVGQAEISAFAPDFKSNTAEILYIFPKTFLIFAFLGGILGVAGKYLQSGSKKFSLKTWVGGILFGFLAVGVWYVMGINLLGFTLPDIYNEASVLFIGALAAWGLAPKPLKPQE